MLSSTWLALFVSLSSAAAIPGPSSIPTGSCCFTLHNTSDKPVQQERTEGLMYFNSDEPDAWFCIDLSDKRDILFDDFDNTCIVNFSGQFQCLDPTRGGDSWTLKTSKNVTLLARNGDTSFWSCPEKDGSSALFGTDSTTISGCKKTTLKAEGFKGTCPGIKSR